MIELFLDKKSLGKSRLIEKVDVTFDSHVDALRFDAFDTACIKIVDSAKYISNQQVQTPFGLTEMINISTGCKTLILINHAHDLDNAVVNIGECGANVLNMIFKLNDCRVYLPFKLIPDEFEPKKKIRVYKNNNYRIKTLEQYFGGTT